MATSSSSGDVCTQVCHIRLGYIRGKPLQALAKKEPLEGAPTCNMELGGHGVLDTKTKVKFGTTTHSSEGLFNYVHVCIWELAKTASLEGYMYFIFFTDNLSKHCWIYLMR